MVDELRGYKVVVVPSDLSGLVIDAGEFRLTDYFRSQVDAERLARFQRKPRSWRR